jgi:hypothetical protein
VLAVSGDPALDPKAKVPKARRSRAKQVVGISTGAEQADDVLRVHAAVVDLQVEVLQEAIEVLRATIAPLPAGIERLLTIEERRALERDRDLAVQGKAIEDLKNELRSAIARLEAAQERAANSHTGVLAAVEERIMAAVNALGVRLSGDLDWVKGRLWAAFGLIAVAGAVAAAVTQVAT